MTETKTLNHEQGYPAVGGNSRAAHNQNLVRPKPTVKRNPVTQNTIAPIYRE